MVFFIKGPSSELSNWSKSRFRDTSSESEINYRIMLTGDDSSGKTSLVNRFRDRVHHESLTTIGVDYSKFSLSSPEQNFKLHLWDGSGQERFRGIIRPYYSGRDAFIVCFSLDNKSALTRLDGWLGDIKKYKNDKPVSIILAGTKADCAYERCLSDDDINQFMSGWNNEHPDTPVAGYIETSAKTGMNVDFLFNKATQICWLKQQESSLLPAELTALIKADITRRLAQYISETDQKRDAQGSFESDFSMFSASQAYNREIDYQIALQLQSELNAPVDLCSVFHPLHLNGLRQDVVSRHASLRRGNPGFFSLPHDINRGRLGVLWNDSVDLITRSMTTPP